MSDRESLDDQPQSKNSQTKRYETLCTISLFLCLFLFSISRLFSCCVLAASNGWKRSMDRIADQHFFFFMISFCTRCFLCGMACLCAKLKERTNAHLGVWRTINPRAFIPFVYERSEGDVSNREDTVCNESFCICMHAQSSPFASLRPVLSSAARKESLFFNGTQDSRWPAACRSRI